MQHCDEETLALAALEPSSLDQLSSQHIHHCAKCTAELESFLLVTSTMRTAGPTALTVPPAGLWESIDAATARPNLRSVPAPGASPDPTQADDSAPRRRRSWLPMAAAAMIGAVVGGAAVVGVLDSDQAAPIAQPAPSASVVASASLQPLGDAGKATTGSGNAAVESNESGLQLGISTAGLEATEGYYEVWLIDPDTMDMLSIGSINAGDQNSFLPIPTGVDLGKYSVVDISDEPLNGDPTHSKVSVLRGQLPA